MTEVKSAPTNQQIADEFKRLAAITTDNKYRKATFERAAREIPKLPPIRSGSDVLHVRGLGEGVAERIDEMLKTGVISEIPEEKRQVAQIISELSTVHDIGQAKATQLVEAGVKSIDDLKAKVNAGLVKLDSAQMAGLKYYDDFRQPIPYDEIEKVGRWIISVLKWGDKSAVGEIVGSHRRGSPTSNDVDILITSDNRSEVLQRLVGYLTGAKFLIWKLSQGEVKFQGIYMSGYPEEKGTPAYEIGGVQIGSKPIARKIDIRYTPPESWHASLLHSTGPWNFNEDLRLLWKRRGKLNEYGLYDTEGRLVPTNSEEEIMKIVGVRYIPPSDRGKVALTPL